MAKYQLRLYDDRLGAKIALTQPYAALNRVLYVADGMATVKSGGETAATLSSNSAWYNASETTVSAGADGVHILRYELVDGAASDGDSLITGAGVSSVLLYQAEVDLNPGDDYLMRCDRVDIPPSGIAYTHTHQGPGIRCLLKGGFTVETQGHKTTIDAGEAWFEAGPDPVLAYAPPDRPGNFSRVMVLPRNLLGKSSITYVNADDATKPKLQRYTVFIDEFITI
ncbi:MAG: hypothetical protein GKS01_19070 [Alphaproteobacteria bacterium]|nr:hypothetical protein [Alphaproteobacteria bacterium]